jgi:hypothetical protein
MIKRFGDWLIEHMTRRAPDFVIGSNDDPYLLRWWVIPRNPAFNIYLHYFMRSDDDRALHDHPWSNVSILLRGVYLEHTKAADADLRTAGDIVIRRSGRMAHRIELIDGPCWTLFLTGPRYRHWGFLCPNGWIHWKKFTAAGNRGEIGRGCDQ